MDRCSPASPINGMMMERISRVLALGLVLLCVAQVDGYQKYGRSCRDIGCRTDQVCVLAVDPCPLYSSDRDNCGSYPTCVKSNVVASTHASPRVHEDSVDDHHPVNFGTNLGYPADPPGNGYSNNNNNNGNTGSVYSSHPSSSGTILGYPPDPVNRMPSPGRPGVYHGIPPPQAGGNYPANTAPGNPSYPPNNYYPGQTNYGSPNRNYNNPYYPRPLNSAPKSRLSVATSFIVVGFTIVVANMYLS